MGLFGANTAWLQNQISAVVGFVPRINLARQIETDWDQYRNENPGIRLMGRICHVINELPFVRHRDQFGLVSTYASLVAAPTLHRQFFLSAKYKDHILLMLDEAHILGYNGIDAVGTQAAREILALAENAALIILMTGTAYRGDGQKLLLARYSDPDADGVSYLQADVTASYSGRCSRRLSTTR